MNRRRFLELLGLATVGGTVAYSFPSIIVPQNIIPVELPAPNLMASALGNAGSVENWVDFYRQHILAAQDWMQLEHPVWTYLSHKESRGVRFYFEENK